VETGGPCEKLRADARSGELFVRVGKIQIEIELEDVDAGLAEHAKVATAGVRSHEAAHLTFGNAARTGDAGHLKFRGGG
jgi:hypothetical protein